MPGDESDLEGPDDQSYWSPFGSSLNGASPAPRDWTSPQAWAGLDPALIHAYGLLDPLDVPKPMPGLLGSLDDLPGATGRMSGQVDPAFLMAAYTMPRQLGGAPLPYHAIPSPHAGHYATMDEAAKAAASDVPRNADAEYNAYIPGRLVTENIDLGDGFGPNPISYVDGYDYGGLYTSGNTAHGTFGMHPTDHGAWFHNHPWDFDLGVNETNQRPSSGPGKDQDVINQLHQDHPLIETYILGPDGILRQFWQPGDRGVIVK